MPNYASQTLHHILFITHSSSHTLHHTLFITHSLSHTLHHTLFHTLHHTLFITANPLLPSPIPLTDRTESGPVCEGMRRKLVRVMAGQVSLSPPPPLPPPSLTGKTESDPVVKGMRRKLVRVIAGRVSLFPPPPFDRQNRETLSG